MLKVITVISGFCLGLRTITDTDKIFYFVRKWFLKTKVCKGTLEHKFIIPEWISKPLILCVSCYSSFYGSLIFWGIVFMFKQDLSYLLFLQWVFVCVVCSFINGFLWSLYQKISN
jgi:hypothetical protein